MVVGTTDVQGMVWLLDNVSKGNGTKVWKVCGPASGEAL